tara:strand:- start:413 stop:583 length:171 start_codon:yes stop_codon:yes gene_type:complete
MFLWAGTQADSSASHAYTCTIAGFMRLGWCEKLKFRQFFIMKHEFPSYFVPPMWIH